MDELATYENKLTIGKFNFDKTGIIVTGDPTFEEWQNCGDFLKQAEKSVQWWIGDWLNYGESRYGETYSQALEITDYENKTLRNSKWVSSKVELSRRRDNLSFSHHAEVAQLPPKEQEFWLEKAETDGLTKNDLRRAIKHQSVIPTQPHDATVELKIGDMINIVPGLGKFYLIVADPPYNVTEWEWDKIGDGFIDEAKEWLTICKNALAEKYHFFWFCSPKYAADTEMLFRQLDLPIKSRIIWHRRNMAMGSDAKDKFIDSWEMIFHSGNYPLNFPIDWDESRFDVQTFAVPQTNFNDAKLHPTQKPIELIRNLVLFGSYPGSRVLDPFAGAGTTGAVCDNRDCILVEREEEYANIIAARLSI